ncbi:mitogen-activated protein kinase kinase kinase 5-like isoform X2 [Olea europaea var. sylvestris]|uniref:mitogen-activated protein kinase kinase kinase n=1 Tax=Olea europaea subsp. europaea TaxID=158383 RepID=A0A8S0RMX1_OLEEU|nr:mitogen-activated protein kinase kinase kinase 5-like isoform X2 [Olea europaea var. sylvestris]CAA2981278.1 Mitogen-activated protein kinase kinase kinase YODA [Olea europaea subsp. europaea]
MHWWQGAFTPSSKSNSDDNLIGGGMGRYTLKTDMCSSTKSRQLTRARKLRHLTDNDVELWRTPTHGVNLPSQPCPQPLPLPLPEDHVLLGHDVKLNGSATNSYNLPSPYDALSKVGHRGCGGGEERNIEREKSKELNADTIDGPNMLNRLDGQDTQMNAACTEMRSSGKSSRAENGLERSSNNYNINVPVSAPTSPYSSPGLSPPRGGSDFLAAHYLTPPSIFQAWSGLEVPHSDANLGLGFSYQILPQKSASSDDSSPVRGPRASSHRRTSVTRPLSWHESNSQATVHPLPLPPGAALPSLATPVSPNPSRTEFPVTSMPSQPTPISPLAPKSSFPGATMPSLPTTIYPVPVKPELMPIKGKWQKGKLIGRGTFGSVYVASNRETGALCAMKEVEILPDDPKAAECMRQLEQEIKVLSNLKHPNIVQYYGSEIVGDRFYIYLEYVHPGSINKFIRDHCGAITECVVRNFTRHILCGLAYLHSTKTIHRDIKGANLLVDACGVVKLADFGMAKHMTGQAANLSLKGSPYWMAPELLQSLMQIDASSDLALAVDIWSLGCTIIEMMNGKPPWSECEGPAALFKVLKENPPIPETMSADGKDFLRRCFRRNPADRPTASMLLEHPFVNQLINEITSTGNKKFQQPSYQFDQVPVSKDTRTTKGKLQATMRLANEVNVKYPI